MLDTPTFPMTGSAALWQGRPVRIHQWNNDGTALIFGEGFSRRAEPEELTPPAPLDAFQQWRETRILSSGRSCFTAIEDLWSDYRAFCAARGLSDFQIQTSLAFGRRVYAAGFTSRHAYEREPFSTISTLRHGFQIELRPLPAETQVAPAPAPKKIKRSRARKTARS